jgi:hypothetical protein
MSGINRRFSNSELSTAKAILTLFAHESAHYWEEALLSDSFMHKGRVNYCYKSELDREHWENKPNDDAPPLSARQIINFHNAFMNYAKTSIEDMLEDDKVVAKVLYDLEERIPKNERLYDQEVSFGGWGFYPTEEVARAMENAKITGAMKLESAFCNTHIVLRKGTIYCRHNGEVALMDIYKP